MDYREKKKILEQYRKTPDSIKRLRELVLNFKKWRRIDE